MAQSVVEAMLPELVESLRTKADEGDQRAIEVLMRHGLATAAPRTMIEAADLQHLPAEDRIAAINAQVATGLLPLEHGKAPAHLARTEMGLQLLQPLRTFMRDLKTGLATEAALARLAKMAKTLPVIGQGEAENAP